MGRIGRPNPATSLDYGLFASRSRIEPDPARDRVVSGHAGKDPRILGGVPGHDRLLRFRPRELVK